MSEIAVGLIAFGVMLLLFALRVPISFAMAIVGFAGFSYLVSPKAALTLIAHDIWYNFANYNYTVLPMFVLMGSFAYVSGIGDRLYSASSVVMGKTRGGLAAATIGACACFSAISGTTVGTAAAMGRVALPEMKKYGYDDSLATGCVAAGGSLGILIPPSSLMIIYGILTGQSIGKLFLAGIFPGILLTILFLAVIVALCHYNPRLAPAGGPTTWKEKLRAIMGIWEAAILFSLVLGGLFAGWFSPTQAGTAGAAGTLIIALVRRKLTWAGVSYAIRDTLDVCGLSMFIIFGAVVFGHFMAVSTIPMLLVEAIKVLPLPPEATMGAIIFLYFLAGFCMDAFGLMVLTVPIIYPVVEALGFDLIWFGVVVMLIIEMGVITPPVGINVYVIKGVAPDVPLESIFKGIFPFLAAEIVAAALLVFFPEIVTYLPGLMVY